MKLTYPLLYDSGALHVAVVRESIFWEWYLPSLKVQIEIPGTEISQ